MLEQEPDQPQTIEALLAAVKSQEARIAKLEGDGQKTLLKRLTTSASAGALFLGLILTFASLYDTFATKPETQRIERLSQFNNAVNSATKTRQEVLELLSRTSDPKVQLAVMSMATPRVLNDISTARAMLRDINDRDVGIPQLIVLTQEALNTGDMESAREFVARAVGKTDVTPYLRSEAKRIEGRLLFASGDPLRARQSFQEAVETLGPSPASASARAYVLSELLIAELVLGDCTSAAIQMQRFDAALRMPGVAPQARLQMTAAVQDQMVQLGDARCPQVPRLNPIMSR
jgi:hypothetical protein